MPDNAEIIDLMKESIRSDGRYGVVKGLDGDKKKAADSVSLENETKDDSQRIYGDYDNYNRRRKSELGQGIVEKDEHLLKYIQSNSLASTVSKDDWGNLGNFTNVAKELVIGTSPILQGIRSMSHVYDYIKPTDSSYFMRGLVTSLTKENPELAAEFIEGMSYHMPGAFQPALLTGSKAIRDFAATINPEGYERATKSMFDVRGVGDAWAWGMETLGSGIGSIIPSVVVGGAGAVAGGAAAGPPGAIAGGLAGAGSVSYAMGYGEVYKALKDEKIDPASAAGYAAAAAVPIAALDLASFGSIAGKALGAGAKKEIVRGIAKRIAIEAAKGTSKEGITESLQEIIKDAVVSYAADKEFGTPEQIKGWVESGVAGGMIGGLAQGATGIRGNKDLLDLKKGADVTTRTLENGEPWVKAGQTPPVGVDPIIDHLIGLDSQGKMEVLDSIMDNAEKTETKELSPELWAELNKIVFEKKQIEIRWDMVKALYGDKVPEPNDKLLGFVPDIQKQFENSNLTGESIKINLADWVAKVDPEINKLLHDDIAFTDGMTINEAKARPTLDQITKYTEIPETAFPEMPQELDKPYSLSKGKEGKYDILDEHGAIAAGVRVTETEGGNNLHIHWETGQIDVAGLRTLMKQLKEEYPNAETISGPRLPGTEALQRGLQGSKITVGMPFRIKEQTVDIVRRSAGLEPLFDLPREGPRAVRLVRNVGQNITPGDVNFTITDEVGNPIGEVETTLRQKGKDIYISWVGEPLGQREMGGDLLNKLGPKLIRNLFREFKREFPKALTVTGFRVTGSRGTYGQPEVVQINLAKLMEEQARAPAGWEGVEGGTQAPETAKLVDMTQGWAEFGPQLIAQRQREWTPQELALESKITKLLNKIAPKEVMVTGAEDIRMGKEQRRVYGALQMYYDRRPLILWSLESPDAVGVARHEAVHFLRQYGYINDKEWEILAKHVKDNNLIKKHGVDSRYPNASEELQIEESIAEEFREWANKPDPTHPFAKAFQAIKEILESIKSAYREHFGREPTVEDIFGDIERGRVGRRTPGPSIEPGLREPLAMEPLLPPIEQVPTFEPGALMDKARYAKYMKLINERNNEDAQRELKKAQADIKRKEKPEWQAKEAEMKTEVTKEIANRPDWKVSQFFRNGMFFGMDSKYRPKIDPKFLTPEQQAGLPKQFMNKGGMDPDMLAGSFGYSTGKALVDRMVEFERVKGKLGPKEFFDAMVKAETERRMGLRYGDMAEEILKEAMDHVVGTTQMDLLHEETMALALRAGQAFSLTKEDFRNQAATRFHNETASQVSMRGYFREMYRAGKAAELAFLQGDWVTAFQQKQQQVHLFTLAEHAKKFEKVQKNFEGIVKEFNKRDHDVKKISPEFVEWIHTILFQIQRPPKRLPEDLARLIATRDSRTLQDFVNDKNTFITGNEEFETEVNPTLVVWDKLMEVDQNGVPTYSKAFDDLTVGEVKAINISLQSLKKIGRDEQKFIIAGESKVKRDWINQAKNQLSRLGEKKEPGVIKSGMQWMHGGLVQLEAMFDRWDRGNRGGMFTKMFSFPLARASDNFSTMQREFARKIVDIDKKYGMTRSDMKTLIDNDVFYDPKWAELDERKQLIDNGKWLQMTREHIRGVILNWGNPSNRQRLAEGYYTTVDKIQGWLDKHATERDYQWAREVGRLYKEIQKDSDEMTYRMSGTLVEMLPLPNFQTPFGEYEGYYYPIIYDWSKGGGPRLKPDRPPPTVALTYNGWERKRTGSAGPLDLSLGEMGNFISRRLKDNAFRETLHNIHKIWSDKEFRKYVSRYHGEYGVKLLDQAYRDFAGHTGITSGVSGAANQFAELIRQNTIGVLIGYNPGTVMKHFTSALLQSWKEAGITKSDFYTSMLALSNPVTRGQHVKFMMEGGMVGDLDFKGSGTLNRRHQNWAETIGGAGDIQLRSLTARERFLRAGSTPVAWSDLYSSQILWKAKYDKVMDTLQGTMPIEEAHVQAEEQADYAVRRTHGSTAITSRPEFMRSQSAMTRYLTSLYGFFNHIYNRFYRMAWTAKDLGLDTWRGEKNFGEFMKGSADLTSDFMMYIVGPALIEAIVVEGLMSADWDDMGWGDILAKGMIHTVSASVPIVREAVHAVVTGHDPSVGLVGTSVKAFTDLARDFSKEELDAGKIFQHGLTVSGIMSGLGSAQLGKWGKFLINYQSGQEDPQDLEEWYRVFRSGTTEMRKGH